MEGIQHRRDCPTRTGQQLAVEITVSAEDSDGHVVTISRCSACGRSAIVRRLPPKGKLL